MRGAALCMVVLLLLALQQTCSTHPVFLYARVGQSITLPCSGAPNRVVEWHFKQPAFPDWLLVAELHNGSISPGPGFQERVKSVCEEPGNYSLVLSPVVYNDRDIYECRDKDGPILSDVKLHISVPPNVSIVVGMPASLPCYGDISKQAKDVDLDILWKRDGKMVYHLYNNTVTYGPGFENRTSLSSEQALHGDLSLTIKQTQFSDQGHYRCFYNSQKERGNPDSARLHVTGLPPSVGETTGAVHSIVLIVVFGCFGCICLGLAVWMYCNNRREAVQRIIYQSAALEDPSGSSRRTELQQPEVPEPSLSVTETQPADPKTRPLLSETDPTEPHLPVSETDLTEPHLPVSETGPSDRTEVQEKKSEEVQRWNDALE